MEAMITELTPSQIMTALGLTPRHVRRRARAENWHAVFRNSRGGKGIRYPLDGIPAETRRQILLKINDDAAAGYDLLAGIRQAEQEKQRAREESLARYAALPEVRQKEAEARREILKTRDAFIAAARMPVKKGSQVFCRELKAGNASLPEWVMDAAVRRNGTLSLSWPTLCRWQKAYEEGGIAGLAGHYKTARESRIPEHMQNFLKAMIHDHPHSNIPKMMSALEARYWGEDLPHESSVRRWTARYRDENKSLLLKNENPDAWRNKYMAADGSMSENIVRLNQLWEMDSTPGDVMLIDGRHNLVGVIDVFSRRSRLRVTPTSRAETIAALIRSSMLDWGVPEAIKTDNGSDYTADHIRRVLDELEVYQDICPPFSPEKKPFIERFFGTFSHDIVELLPGYVGHNVADRKAIEARRSFAQRLMSKGEEPVEISLTSDQFQQICDRWIEAVYHRNPHSGLGEKTPAQVAAEWTGPVRRIDPEKERGLDLLLCPAPRNDGYRTIGAKGIDVDNIAYSAKEMAGYEGRRVFVLIDRVDLGAVYCFLPRPDGGREFLCKAVNPDFAGVSRMEVARARKARQNEVMAEGRKALRKLSREMSTKHIAQEVLSFREARLADSDLSESFEENTEIYATSALDEAADAIDQIRRAELGPEPIGITAAQESAANEVIRLAERKSRPSLPASPWEAYRILIEERERGLPLTANEEQWIEEYDHYMETGKETGLLAAGFQPFAERRRMEVPKVGSELK